MTRLELAQKAIGLDTGIEEYWKRADAENEKREKRERETLTLPVVETRGFTTVSVTVLFRLILIEDDGEAPRLHCRFSHMVSVL